MFDLHNLGWNSFQQLCLTITREILGQTVESYLDSGDGGRDGAFKGTWKPHGLEELDGHFVIQCKFTSRINYVLKMSDLAEEVEKAKKLITAGICDSYVLMTNAGLRGTRTAEITALYKDAGVKHVVVLDATWIDQQIRENKRLRMLVPRVYGLGDLSQILDERAYNQARAILESMREDLAKVVVTDAYQRAVEAIDKHRFVMLVGEPASGKTTVASLLAMAMLDQWNASPLKLDTPEKMLERWNPDEPSQFFWLDDAFGVTQYEDSLVRQWNHVLPQVLAMLRKGAKIVMTSRDYIYSRARRDLKESAFPLMNESQVVIDVRALSIEEKRQILYNHLKLGKQKRSFLTKIKPYLEDVAGHRRFIPETARRLADPIFTRDLIIGSYHIEQFVERREQLLQEVIQGLDQDSKAALALIYMRNGRLCSPINLQRSERDALERLGSNLGGCVTALEALKGSLVVHTHQTGEPAWNFKHPTIGDAYASSLTQSPEHLGIYIQGSAPERLVDQVTCGDVGIENAVVVPRSLFQLMMSKLMRFSQSKSYKSPWLSEWGAKRELLGFLARRCSKEFLSEYLQFNPDLINQVSRPGLFLNSVPEVRLAIRLHEFGLLPEDKRREFVETVSEYALEGQDSDALVDEQIRTLFTDDEFGDLVNRVRTELVPRLDDVRRELQFSHSSGESPEDCMRPLLDVFDSLMRQFGHDDDAVRIIEREIQQAREWIDENSSEEPNIIPRPLGKVETIEQSHSVRSIFDDIDTAEGAEIV